MKTKLFKIAILFAFTLQLRAAPLDNHTFTAVINDVSVIPATNSIAAPAHTNDNFKSSDFVRTGSDSRAELTAVDGTVTRVGANSVFSFEPSTRTLDLEKGNVLFHPPKGSGGGTIVSGGASAAVLGTTLIVSATADGGFKVIMLEGSGKITLPNGKSVTLHAGQEVFVLPGGTGFSEVLEINLGQLVAGSQLVNGFPDVLSSMPLIQAAIDKQNNEISSGEVTDTGEPADNFEPGNGFTIDLGSLESAVIVPQTTSPDGQKP